MSDSGSAPPPPDPFATATAQGAQNRETAAFNAALARADQVTPWGTLKWEVDPTSGPQYNTEAYQKALEAYAAGGGGAKEWVPGEAGGDNTPGTAGYWKDVPGVAGNAPKLEEFKISDGAPKYTSRMELTPQQQALFDAQQGSQLKLANLGGSAIDRAQGLLGSNVDFSGLPEIESGEGARQRLTDALYRRGARLMDPRFAQQEEAERNRLLNSGFSVNSEGFNKAMGNLRQSRDTAYADLEDRAIAAGGSEADRAFNQSTAARRQLLQEILLERQLPLQEINAMRTGAQMQLPNFSPTQGVSGMQPVDLASLIGQQYQGQLQGWQGDVANTNANNAAGASLLGAAAVAAGF